MNIHLNLFLTFAKIGVCTFGGGYAMLTILDRELVDDRGWATPEQLADYYAIGQCTPGIIAVNTATFVGNAQAGLTGGIAATLGLVFPSVVIITLLAAFLSGFAHLPVVAHAFGGVRAGVVALILSAVLRLSKTSLVDGPTRAIWLAVLALSAVGAFAPSPAGVAASALAAVTSPVTLVLASGVVGVCLRLRKGGAKK